jgi:hypothetical protein
MLDALGLREAYEAVVTLPETRQLERAAAALEADREALGPPPHEHEPNDI